MTRGESLRSLPGDSELGKSYGVIRRLFLVVIVLAVLTPHRTEFIPNQANQYKARVIREARAMGGLAAPSAMFGAQIHQESHYNLNAKSGVGALGIAQFMPGSAQWIAHVYPQQLGTAAPLDPAWAIRALVYYDYWNYKRLPMFEDAQQSRWAASLAAYNGGLGWTLKDAHIGSCSVWWGCADEVNDGRSLANLKQNREYPERIIHVLQPIYTHAGW